jgi:hypothetical protein
MKEIKINVLFPFTTAFGIWLCATSRLSWWTFILMVLYTTKLYMKFRRKG